MDHTQIENYSHESLQILYSLNYTKWESFKAVVLSVCISAILQMTATVNSVWYDVSCRIVENYIYPPMSPIHKQNLELRSGVQYAMRVIDCLRLHSWVSGLNARDKTPMYEMPLICVWGLGIGVLGLG